MNLAPYRKTITAVVTGLIGWATAVVASDPARITASEWIVFATALATALGVYAIPNTGRLDGGQRGQSLIGFLYALVLILVAIFLIILISERT